MEDDESTEDTGGFDENLAEGGDAPMDSGSGGDGGNPLAAALSAVDSALSYGRQRHGLLGGNEPSENIEDRRGDAPGPEQLSVDANVQYGMRNPNQPMPSSARNAWSAVAGKMTGRMGFAKGGL